MANTQFVSSNVVAERLRTLAQLYQEGGASEVMERTLDKLLAHEAEICREQLRQLQADLTDFEERYGLPTAEFYRRFRDGETDDRMDYVEWASLAQMAQRLEERLRILTAEG